MQSEDIEISIHNVKGSLIQTLYNGRKESGSHKLTWKGLNKQEKQLSSGIYLVNLISENQVKQITIIIRH